MKEKGKGRVNAKGDVSDEPRVRFEQAKSLTVHLEVNGRTTAQ